MADMYDDSSTIIGQDSFAESGVPLISPARKRNTMNRRRRDMHDRLSSVHEYLADPSPDPQWEKMMKVLNVLLDIFWIVASMAVFHLTDFYVRVLYDPHMDR